MIVMRSCKKDGTSYKGFQWPTESGVEVVCPDWKPTKQCGNGFHGLLPGQNDPGVWYGELIYFLEVEDLIDLSNKVKFEKGKILFCGEPTEAWAWAHLNAPGPWYKGTATAGYYGTATAGREGMLCIRYWDGSRRRLKIAYVGEDGIRANTPYKLDNEGNFVEVKK